MLKKILPLLPEAELLSVFEGVPQCEVSKSEVVGMGINGLLSDVTGFLSSKGDAKRAIKENSIRMNKEIVDASKVIEESDLLNGKQILLQRGKKNYFLVRVK